MDATLWETCLFANEKPGVEEGRSSSTVGCALAGPMPLPKKTEVQMLHAALTGLQAHTVPDTPPGGLLSGSSWSVH
jgi:hypothetical protein